MTTSGLGEIQRISLRQRDERPADVIERRIRRMCAEDRRALMAAYRDGPLGIEWGDALIAACERVWGTQTALRRMRSA